MKTPGGQRGFTLIELMVVTLIVGVLTSVAIPRFRDTAAEADASRVVQDARSVQFAVMNYLADNPGAMPRRGRWGEIPPDLAPYLTNMPFSFKTISYRFIVRRRRGTTELRVRYPRRDAIGEALRGYREPGKVIWRRRQTIFRFAT